MTTTQDPLVSVVTPVHNGEKFLRECIESVLAQTYPHWDFTIVNNCSTDRTLDIARAYAARDARIRIHENHTFVRVNESHNIALRQISPASKYCKVVAADDWLFPDCLEKMVALAEAHPSVAIVGAYGLAGDKVVWVGLPYRQDPVVARGREACRMRLLGGPYVFGTPTSVLLRGDLVRSRAAFYNESNLHADSEVCFELLADHDFGFLHQVLTFRRDQEDSVTSHSQRLNTYLPGVLEELLRYGRNYLSEEEWSERVHAQLREYYRYLGQQVYRRRGREFWSFHRAKLAALGYPLRKLRLTLAAMAYALDLALNPKSTAEKLARRVLSGPADNS